MSEKRSLNGRDVQVVYGDCHIDPEEVEPDNVIEVALYQTAKFHPERIDYRIDFIRRSLSQLPEAFWEEEGAAFHRGVYDQYGFTWGWVNGADELEMLLLLGMAAGFVEVLPAPAPLIVIRLSFT